MALGPVGPATLTSTAPGRPSGTTACTTESERTVKRAGAEPKRTALAPVKPWPVIVTGVPCTPVACEGPELGATPHVMGLDGERPRRARRSAEESHVAAHGRREAERVVRSPARWEGAEARARLGVERHRLGRTARVARVQAPAGE